jgi:hypothetical protein
VKKTLLVVDGFYNDPDEVRALALGSDFSVRGNYPGLRTGPFLHKGILDGVQRLVEVPIVWWPEDTYNGAFQYTTATDRTWVHTDHTTNYAGVLYLTPEAPPNSGTAFFRHRPSGADHYPTDPDLQAECEADAGNFDRWVITDVVANFYNRMILFDSTRFHASVGTFGSELANARLFQTFFFNVAE